VTDKLLSLFTPFERAWHHRELIRAVVRRELTSRFRDSMLGWVWAIFAPLLMLAAYTAVFSIAAPGFASNMSVTDYAASIYCGLIVFNVFAELAARAPTLLHEHANFIKKSIFPGETIAWTATIRALVYGAISFGTLVAFRLVTVHSLPWTFLLLPLVLIPFVLLMLGLVWFLMALGAFTRDVSHLMVSIVPILMFVTPIFFSIEQAPAGLRWLLRLNPVGNVVEMVRDVALVGQFPSPLLYGASIVASWAVFVFGYRFFHEYKSVIVDVI
jgi:lipopolysaccharide transport system permease protein